MKSMTPIKMVLNSYFVLVLMIGIIPKFTFAQRMECTVISPSIVDISDKLKPTMNTASLISNTCKEYLIINKKTTYVGSSIFDSLYLRITPETMDRESNCVVTSVFVGGTKVEFIFYVVTFPEERIVRYLKTYSDIDQISSPLKFKEYLFNNLDSLFKNGKIPFEAESEFIALTAHLKAEFETNNALKTKNNPFSDYNLENVRGKNSLKLAINRIDYYLNEINKEYPFKKYPAQIAQSLIDSKIELDEIEQTYPHTYFLLKANFFLNQYLHLKHLNHVSKTDLKLREDSMNRYIYLLDSINDVRYLSDEEIQAFESLGKSFLNELFLFAKVKSKAVDECDTFISDYNLSLKTNDTNLKIRRLLELVLEKCGGSVLDIRKQQNNRNIQKYKALATMDTLTSINMLALLATQDNYLSPTLINKSSFRTEKLEKENINRYLSHSLNRSVNAAYTKFNYSIEHNGRSVSLKFSLDGDMGRFGSFLSSYPLGMAKFDGIENYFEFISSSIKNIELIFGVDLENIYIVGQSDATPFKQSYEVKLNDLDKPNEKFRILLPTQENTDLTELDLKNNSDDKNIAIAFKRAYFLQEYLLESGVLQNERNLIYVEYYNDQVGKSFRKCNVTATFSTK